MSEKREREDRFEIDEKTLDYKKIDDKDNNISEKVERMQQERKFLKILPPVQDKAEIPIRAPLMMMLGDQSTEKQVLIKKQEKTDSKQLKGDSELKSGNQKQMKPTQQQNTMFGAYFKNGVGLFTKTHDQSIPPRKLFDLNFGGEKKVQIINIFGPPGKLFSNTNQSLFYKGEEKTKNNEQKKQNKEQEKQKQKAREIEKQKQKQKLKSKQKIQQKVKADGSDAQENEEGDEQYERELQKQQALNLDPTKSTGKYEYSNDCNILFQSKALKMKKQNSEVVQDIQVIVQEDPQTKRSWVLINLISTKVRIFTGLILKGITSIKNFGGKQENVVISVLKVTKKQNPEKEIIKLQFEKPKQGEKFMETIRNIIQ